MAKLDTESVPAIAGRFAIHSIPSMIMIHKGREIARTSGAMPTSAIIQWVEQGWVVPDTADAGLVFHEIDVARVRLIHDLRRDMEIGEDAIPLVLSLLDQVYELRSRMNAILRALSSQSEDVRVAVLDALQPGVREP